MQSTNLFSGNFFQNAAQNSNSAQTKSLFSNQNNQGMLNSGKPGSTNKFSIGMSNTNTNQPKSTDIFSGNTGMTGVSGIFGQSGINQNQNPNIMQGNPTQNIFGSTMNTNQAQTNPQSAGIFPQATNGGIMSQGLFGNANTSNPQMVQGQNTSIQTPTKTNQAFGGNLFGNMGVQNKAPQTNLFGNTATQQAATTNIFGALNQPQNMGNMGQNIGNVGQNMGNMGQNLGNMGQNMGQTFGQNLNQPIAILGPGTFDLQYTPSKIEENTQGSTKGGYVNLCSISAMPQYASKSFEELRYEDIKLKKQGKVLQKSSNIQGPMGNIANVFNTNTNANKGQTSITGFFPPQQQTQQGLQQQQGQGSSLFGGFNTTQNTTGGVFGQNTNQNTTGGVIGQNTNQNPTSGIFQQNATQNPTGGMFGQNTNLNQQQPQTGLFNTTNQQQPALFNQQQNPGTAAGLFTGNQQQSGGLFIQPQQQALQQQGGLTSLGGTTNLNQQSNTGLFATKPTNQGGLFSNTTQQPSNFTSMISANQNQPLNQPTNQSTSLFGGSTNTTNTQTGGGLFGNNNTGNTQTTGGGLFGNTNTGNTQTTGGGLFGNTNATLLFTGNTQNQAQTQNKPGAFLFSTGTNAPTSLFGNVQSTAPSSNPLFNNINSTQGTANQGASTGYTNTPGGNIDYSSLPLNILGLNIDTIHADVKEAVFKGTPFKVLQDQWHDRYEKELQEEEMRKRRKHERARYSVPDYTMISSKERKSKSYYDNYFSDYEYKNHEESKTDIDEKRNKPHSYFSRNVDGLKTAPRSLLQSKRNADNDLSYNRALINFNNIHYDTFVSPFAKRRKEEQSKKQSDEISYTEYTEEAIDDIIANGSETKPESNSIRIIFEVANVSNIDIFSSCIYKGSAITSLKEFLVEKLKHKHPKLKKITTKDLGLLLNHNQMLSDSKKLSDYEPKPNDVIQINIAVSHSHYDDESPTNKRFRLKSEHHQDKKSKAMPEINRIPKLEDKAFTTVPPYSIICRMSAEELAKVTNFEIINAFCRIVWEQDVNLLDLDLDDIIQFKDGQLKFYRGITPLPQAGQGLNKASTCYYKISPDVDEDEINDVVKKTIKEFNRNNTENKKLNFNKTTKEFYFQLGPILRHEKLSSENGINGIDESRKIIC